MKCLRALYELIDTNKSPGCSKMLLQTIYRKSGKLKLNPNLLKSGSDSGPLFELGLIEQDKHNNVVLTDKAREIIQQTNL